MISLVVTAHASQVMEERHIELAWVERVLFNPDQIEPHVTDADLEHRYGAIAERDNRVLHIVVSKSQPQRLITVYFDRARKGTP
jgi:uncharacterized DUF497 family protein